MPDIRTILPVLLLLTCLGMLPSNAQAQAAQSPGASVTVELLESRIQEIEASGELDEANKTAILDYYRKAISLIEQRNSYATATAGFVKARESAPKQSASLRQQLEKLEARAAQKLPDSLVRKALPQLEQQLLGEKADLTGLTTSVAEIEVSLEAQSLRSQQARERLNEAKGRQTEIAEAQQLPAPEGQLPRLTEARRWSLEQEARALGAEIEMLDQELLSQPMRIELLGAQRDKASLELNRQQNYVELLESMVAERRLRDAETVKEATEETE